MIASALLALFVIVGTTLSAQAQPADILPLPLPTITLTVSDLLTTTVTLPRITVTTTKKLPGRLRTVTETATVVRRSTAMAHSTRTVRVPGPVTTQQVTLPRQTMTRTATITKPPVTSTVTATVTPPPEVNTVTITKTRAAGISIALVLIGAILALLLIWAAFTYGWIKGDGGNRKFIKDTVDDLRYDK